MIVFSRRNSACPGAPPRGLVTCFTKVYATDTFFAVLPLLQYAAKAAASSIVCLLGASLRPSLRRTTCEPAYPRA